MLITGASSSVPYFPPPSSAAVSQAGPGAASPSTAPGTTPDTDQALAAAKRPADAEQARAGVQQLDDSELKLLRQLKARDREVRAHEQAHQAVGGAYAGAVSYTYQRGPDGAQYAVGGEVPIDLSPVAGDPQATIDKMRTVRAAALAPAEPSGQDRAVAAQAMQQMLQAQTELAMMRREGEGGSDAAAQGRGDQATRTYRVVGGFSGDTATGSDRFSTRT